MTAELKMMIRHLGGGVVLIEDLLDEDTLRSIDLNLLENTIEPQGYKKIDGKDFMEGGYVIPKEDLASMPIRYMQGIEVLPFLETLNNAMYRGAIEYCKLFPVAAECITDYTGRHFIKYLSGGLMGTHSDASLGYKPDSIEPNSTVALGNTITASIVLNDAFTGGGIKFSAWDLEVYPKPGSALFYPSNYIGAHEVLKITSGIRWAFLAFFSHGDRTYVSSAVNNQYPERYEWTMKFRDSIRNSIGTTEPNLNLSQRKVLISEESAKK
ncbi:Oxoglutarate/iron-dependent dioxygenase [uncultured Caudovirales phage]|uniref:Oxoglutarate/iron-dependent dioxygenase n=1 Tax=uncultured Caudovirales phage TaxID=2100421 RepID=A0A6J5M9N4_9CAUD|nr:Oxoglutarate/iron-dependent dioxygenase [uncultured Caudovirales phage]CAB4162981.1 Oxoglutarate/iron-dependent dioxygenase [uncultured Caudovirales phage]